MKIAIDLQCCQNGSRDRGIGRYALELSKAIINSSSENEYWIVLSDSFPGTFSWVRDAFKGLVCPERIITISLVSPTEGANPANNWRRRAAEIIRHSALVQLKPDILFVPSALEGSWDNVVTFKEGEEFPIVVTAHDFIPFYDQSEHLKQPQDRYAYFRLLRNFLRSDGILAISDYVENQCVWDFGVNVGKIINTSEGVDRRFSPQKIGDSEKNVILNRYNITRKFILNTSPFEHRKNIEGLIEGFSRVPPCVRKNYQIVIIGKMNEFAKKCIKELSVSCGLRKDDVVLTGFVSDLDLVSLYRICDLFVFPSYSEGFGLPPLEAMACGAPTIGSRATSIPEVIGLDDALFDPYDRSDIARVITKALSDSTFYNLLKKHALEQASKFTWETAAKKALKFFEKIATEHKINCRNNISYMGKKREKLAFITYFSEYMDRLKAYNIYVLPILSHLYDISVINLMGPQFHSYIVSDPKVHDQTWFENEAHNFDKIVYSLPENLSEDVISLIEQYPGVLWIHANYGPTSHRKSLPHLNSRHSISDAISVSGITGLILKKQRHNRTLFLDGAVAKLSFGVISDYASLPKANIVPNLGIRIDKTNEVSFRHLLGDTTKNIFCFIVNTEEQDDQFQNEISLIELNKREEIRKSNSIILLCYLNGENFSQKGTSLTRVYSNTYRIDDLFGNFYAGIIAASRKIYYSPINNENQRLMEYVVGDCKASGKIAEEVGLNDLHKVITKVLLSDDNEVIGLEYLPSAKSQEISSEFIEKLGSSINSICCESSLFQYKQLIKSFPKCVEGVEPTSHDMDLVATAIEKNEILFREKTIFIDISGIMDGVVGIDTDIFVMAIIRNISLCLETNFNIKFIMHNYGDYVISTDLVLPAFGYHVDVMHSEKLIVKPGDIVLGIDVLNSFPQRGYQALQWLEQAGALIVYVAGGAICYTSMSTFINSIFDVVKYVSGEEYVSENKSIDEYECKENIYIKENREKVRNLDNWVNCVNCDISSDIWRKKIKIQSFNWYDKYHHKFPIIELNDTGFSKKNYVIMGHIRWIYSLAIINRAVARTLEKENIGCVRFLAYETEHTNDISHMPENELPLMTQLVERKAKSLNSEIFISQHYPILPPPADARLKLALFAWEETNVPQDTIKKLSNCFDAVLSPSQAVSNALINSGIEIPVITTGQPSNIESFVDTGKKRRIFKGSAKTYLHVSSCFPRKGADILLQSWFEAFDADDDVELIIKTFPNPHNTIRQELEALKISCPNGPKVEIIETDLNVSELAALYERADVVVLPTRGEGYNLPALEAMLSGIPLIVTGFGGQTDFCSSEEARIIAYQMLPSNSHVSKEASLWAEPIREDLVLALKEFRDSVWVDKIENRRLRARERALHHSNHIRWLRRFHGAVDVLLTKPVRPQSPKILWISTWNLRCGVATYSEKLIENLSSNFKKNLTVWCDDRTNDQSDAKIIFEKKWTKGLEFEPADFATQISKYKSDIVILQHQNGLMSWQHLLELFKMDVFSDKILFITLHNIRDLMSYEENMVSELASHLKKVDRLLVHNIDDVNYLLDIGVSENVCLFPHGTENPISWPDLRRDFSEENPVIGSHGFFLPHKGIDKLINILPDLKKKWPKLKLKLLNSEFTDDKISKKEIDLCKELAKELGVFEDIEWFTDFMDFNTINNHMKDCDLLVLPYDETIESASGAVRTCMTSLVPIITTDVHIFRELDDAVIRVENDDRQSLLDAVENTLCSYELRYSQQNKIKEWLNIRDWRKMSSRLEAMVLTMIENRSISIL